MTDAAVSLKVSSTSAGSVEEFNEATWLLGHLLPIFGTPATAALLLVGILVVFYILAEICDEALVPALEALSSALVIPHDVACATFLAFGSSVPEICITSLAVMRSGSSGSRARLDVAIGTVTGSGLIAFSVLPALCVSKSPDSKLNLLVVPLVRDVGFYLFGVALLVWFTRDGLVTLAESVALLVCYVAYLVTMLLLVPLYHRSEANDAEHQEQRIRHASEDALEIHELHAIGGGRHGGKHRPPTYGATEASAAARARVSSSGSSESGEEEGQGGRFKACKRLVFRFVPPFQMEEDDVKRHWKWLVAVSIAYVMLLSEIALVLTTALAEAAGLSHHVVGVVLCALGAQIDDAFASMAVAKQGKGPSAIANAIGSQVLNVLFAIGLPFALHGLVIGKPVRISSGKSEDGSGLVLLACVLLFVALALRSKLLDGEFCLRRLDAAALTCAYAAFVLWISWNSE